MIDRNEVSDPPSCDMDKREQLSAASPAGLCERMDL